MQSITWHRRRTTSHAWLRLPGMSWTCWPLHLRCWRLPCSMAPMSPSNSGASTCAGSRSCGEAPSHFYPTAYDLGGQFFLRSIGKSRAVRGSASISWSAEWGNSFAMTGQNGMQDVSNLHQNGASLYFQHCGFQVVLDRMLGPSWQN